MTVIYDEFKYFSKPNDQESKCKSHIEMVNNKNSHKLNLNKKFTQDSPVGFELSEKEHKMFSAFSPGRLTSTSKINPVNCEGTDNNPYDN